MIFLLAYLCVIM